MDKIRSWVRLALLGYWLIMPLPANALRQSMVLTSKALQYVFLPIAQDRGYMKEEGIDLKIVYMRTLPACKRSRPATFSFPVREQRPGCYIQRRRAAQNRVGRQ
jgi:hypothetical protein